MELADQVTDAAAIDAKYKTLGWKRPIVWCAIDPWTPSRDYSGFLQRRGTFPALVKTVGSTTCLRQGLKAMIYRKKKDGDLCNGSQSVRQKIRGSQSR